MKNYILMAHGGILVFSSDTIADSFKIVLIGFVVILARSGNKARSIFVDNTSILVNAKTISFLLFY